MLMINGRFFLRNFAKLSLSFKKQSLKGVCNEKSGVVHRSIVRSNLVNG